MSDRSPPESSESRLTFLPGGRASTSMPVVEHVGRVGEHQPALAAGEEPGEDALELARGVLEGRGEDLLHPLVDLADDVEQVAPGRLEVLAAARRGTGGAPRARRTPPGRAGSPGPAGPGCARRRAAASPAPYATNGTGSGSTSRTSSGAGGDGGTSWCGPYSSTSAVGSTPWSSSAFSLQCLDAQPLLGAGHLVAVDAVGQPLQLGRELAGAAAQRGDLGVALGPGPLGRLPGLRRSGERVLEVRQRRLRRQRDVLRHRGLAGPALPTGLGAGAGLPLLGGGPGQGVGAAGEGPGPLLPRPDGEAGPPSRSGGRAWPAPRAGPRGGVGLEEVRLVGRLLGRGPEPLLELGEGRPVGLQRLAGPGDRASRRSASPRAARACAPSWPSCSATADIRASDSCSWSRAPCTSRDASACSSGERLDREADPVDAGDRPRPAGCGLVDRGLHLEQARRAGRAAGGVVARQHVAVAGDRDEGRVGGHRRPGGCQVARRRRRRRAAAPGRDAGRPGR